MTEQKPRIRKTKEEVIMENEMQWQMNKKKGPATMRSGSTGFNVTPAGTNGNSKGFYKPQLDPKNITSNKKFDEIPDDKSIASKKPPAKPKLIRQPLKKDEKEVKEITGKVGSIAFDSKTNTTTDVERKIDRLHSGPKEVTQKPNFARITSQQQNGPGSPGSLNPYV